MPRGSKPGERRGGRQKGTPNKKTLLRDAALTIAAANPTLSPLGPVGIHREFITAATRWIMEAKL
jgi:hypothetical protein